MKPPDSYRPSPWWFPCRSPGHGGRCVDAEASGSQHAQDLPSSERSSASVSAMQKSMWSSRHQSSIREGQRLARVVLRSRGPSGQPCLPRLAVDRLDRAGRVVKRVHLEPISAKKSASLPWPAPTSSRASAAPAAADRPSPVLARWPRYRSGPRARTAPCPSASAARRATPCVAPRTPVSAAASRSGCRRGAVQPCE